MKYLVLPSLALLLAACNQGEPAPPRDDAAGQAKPPAAGTAPAAAAAREEYRYTRLDDCKLVRSAPEEAGFRQSECAGQGGWRLLLTQADLRDDLTLLALDGGRHDLGLPAIAGGGFSSLGDSAEWRGTVQDGGFVPDRLILRQSVMEGADAQAAETSYLVVVRLSDTPCVLVRILPGPGQNDRARDAADSYDECMAPSG